MGLYLDDIGMFSKTLDQGILGKIVQPKAEQEETGRDLGEEEDQSENGGLGTFEQDETFKKDYLPNWSEE